MSGRHMNSGSTQFLRRDLRLGNRMVEQQILVSSWTTCRGLARSSKVAVMGWTVNVHRSQGRVGWHVARLVENDGWGWTPSKGPR